MDISTLVSNELIKLECMYNECENKLQNLPKGSITQKPINGKNYFYLNYRDGKKVRSKYLGNEESYILNLKEKIRERQELEKQLKDVQKEIKLARKIVR